MRQINFRAYDPKLKQFSYFDLLSAFGMVPEDMRGFVGQMTDLTDRNDREIYEGDILDVFSIENELEGKFTVEWDKYRGGFTIVGQSNPRRQHIFVLDCDIACESAIIGNKYEAR